jgi:predicted HicB family RNase H-like nuclease
MNNVMTISGYRAVIAFDPEISMFRGEFLGLNGGADFYAADVEGLRREGETSLRVFLQACEQRGIDPHKHYSGKFVLRLDPADHEAAAIAAAAHGQSLNQWAVETLREAAQAA